MKCVFCYQDLFCKGRDLEQVIDIGDGLIDVLMNPLIKPLIFTYPIPTGISVQLYDLTFPSPFTFASFKSHEATLAFWVALGAGGGCFKTLLSRPCTGNDKPRIATFMENGEEGFINALGLPGEGVVNFVNRLTHMPFLYCGRPFGFSIGGHNLESYQFVFDTCESVIPSLNIPYYYELNLSCPNTDTGLSIGSDLQSVETLLDYIRAKSNVVVGVKVSPDFEDDYLCRLTTLVSQYDRMFINCGNTSLKGLPIYGLDSLALSRGKGGVSGPLLFRRTCHIVSLLAPIGVPIMATGGICTLDDVLVLKKRGAVLFGFSRNFVVDPSFVSRWNHQFV